MFPLLPSSPIPALSCQAPFWAPVLSSQKPLSPAGPLSASDSGPIPWPSHPSPSLLHDGGLTSHQRPHAGCLPASLCCSSGLSSASGAEPARLRVHPQISTGLSLLNRSSHGRQPLKTQLGSVEKRSISSKKLLTSYLCLKPLSVASAPTSPETAFVRVTGTPYHCSSFLGHPTDSSDFICPKLNPAVAPDLPLVFGVSGSGPIRSLDVSLSFLPPVLCCPSPPTPRGPTS